MINSAIETLNHIIASQKIGHAYIFEGANGVGKLAAALDFAAKIVGSESHESHPDIRVITNELYDSAKAEAKQISVDTVRKMKSEVYVKPYMAERKAYIVPNADTVTSTSGFLSMQNSLLKVFEEPPNYCTIILLAENSNTFLPTILSRAVVIKFSPLDKEQHLRYLLSNEGMPELHADIQKYMSNLMSGRYSAAYEFIAYAKRNKKSSDAIVEFIGSFLEEIFRGKNENTPVSIQSAAKMLDAYLKYRKMINANGNYNACMENMILDLREMISA